MSCIILKLAITSTLIATSAMAFTSNRAIAGSQDQRGITVTIEALDIQSAQLPTADEYYVIDFQAQSGTDSFTQTNGFTDYTYSGDLQIKAADEWGGADVSQYITQDYTEAAGFLESFKIDITEDQKYFGFWWSAGDPYNEITFKNDGETVASFRTENLVDFINNSGTVNTSDYQGNPNPIYDALNNAHKTQPFSFVNVFFNDESAFDEIVITSDKNNSAFESDNHTFSEIKQTIRGEVIPNTAPVANDDTATVSIYNSVTIDVLANDTDPEGDATTITSVDSISGGDAVIEDNKIIYTAGSMPDEFFLTYTVQDAYGKTDSGTVTITVTAFSD